MFILRSTSFVAAVLVGAIGCDTAQTEVQPVDPGAGAVGKADTAGGGPIVVSIDDHGTVVVVTEGQDVAVRLPANPSTGYAWNVAVTDRSFGYPYSSQFISSSAVPGRGGVAEFLWATDGFLPLVGDHSVTLVYKRPWEAAGGSQTKFKVTVRVVPRG